MFFTNCYRRFCLCRHSSHWLKTRSEWTDTNSNSWSRDCTFIECPWNILMWCTCVVHVSFVGPCLTAALASWFHFLTFSCYARWFEKHQEHFCVVQIVYHEFISGAAHSWPHQRHALRAGCMVQSVKLPIPAAISLPPVTETEKMVSGELFYNMDQALVNGRIFAKVCMERLNHSSPLEVAPRNQATLDLLGTRGEGVWIGPPFYCDYGANIHVGAATFLNFNCTILNGAPVTIGERCFFAPNVSIYTATHPIEPRAQSVSEYSRPVTIGSDCWIGVGALILPGVTIGDGCVVGAGAVVTKDVPPHTVVTGEYATISVAACLMDRLHWFESYDEFKIQLGSGTLKIGERKIWNFSVSK